jgi:hypothetical protein
MIIDVIQKIKELSNESSDINEHFSIMLKYGKECEHITEFGVRNVVSTWAWVGSNPKKLICYDIITSSKIHDIYDTTKELGIDFQFIEASTLEIEIEETDLLFIDTEHNYDQMKGELGLHGNKARKYIAFHDTGWATQMNKAITEFMEVNLHWVECETVTNNNGFRVIKRV